MRVDRSMLATFALIAYSLYMGTEYATIVVGPAFLYLGGVMAAYMGLAEWGRINGVQPAADHGGDNKGNPT